MTDDDLLDAYTTPRTESAIRFYGMGFALGKPRIRKDGLLGELGTLGRQEVAMEIPFHCVCGRVEMLHIIHPREAIERGFCNVFDDLRKAGSLDRRHLRSDGYSDAQISKMERRAEVFEGAFRSIPPKGDLR